MSAAAIPGPLSDAQALAYVQVAAQVAGVPMPADRAQRVAFQLVQISRMAASLNSIAMPAELELAEIYRLPRASAAPPGASPGASPSAPEDASGPAPGGRS